MKRHFYILVCLLTIIHYSCKKDESSADSVIQEVIFEADKVELSAGDSVVFKELSTGYVNKWKWTFQGGTPETSSLSSPKVIYSTPGVYEVTLEVMNSHTQKVLTKKEYINVDYNRVKADFKASAAVYFTGETVAFKDTSKGKPVTWQWEFVPVSGGATITSNIANPSIAFTDTGYYNVSLTASNTKYSDKVTKERFIRILDASSISADFTAEQTATYTGGAIQFRDISLGNANSWEWKIEGPENHTLTTQHPLQTFSTPGRYKVTLTVSNPQKSSTKTAENYILVVPGNALAAFFPFNKNPADAGPNQVGTNTIGGGVVYSSADRLGAQGNTAVFSGGSGVVVADNAALNFGTTDYSVSCWVKTSITTRMMIWQESGKNGTNDNQTWLRIGDNTTNRLTRFNVEDNTGSAFVNLAAEGKVSDNAWHHMVCVRQGQTTSVYIDNVKVGSANASTLKNVSNGQDFKIGFQEGATSNSSFFNGNIDDVIIYRKALSEAEIAALFNL